MAENDKDRNLFVRVDKLAKEALTEFERQRPTLTKNLRRYLGDHWDKNPPVGLKQFTINRTLNAIVATAGVQTEQRPRTRITPRESNDPAVVYLSDTGVMKVAELGGLTLTPQQASGDDPISEQVMIEMLAVTSEPAPQPEPVTAPGEEPPEPQAQPQPEPIFTPADFHMIDDHAAAEAMQLVYDALWERADADYHWFDNILQKAIFGYQPMLVQWDDQNHVYELHNVHHANVLIDPTSTGVEDCDYILLFDPMSADEALRRFPEHREIIDKVKRDGQIQHVEIGGGRVSLGAPFKDTNFERNMIVLVTAWMRHEPFDMSPEKAVERGMVQPVQRPVLTEIGDPATDPQGEPELEQETDGQGRPVFQLLDEDGNPGKRVTPGSADWPKESGVRQVQFIADHKIDDRRSPFPDIPFAWNKNIPVPFKPWGQGEPERLWDLQEAVNRIASILHNHLKYYQSPQEYIPNSVREANKNHAPHSHPGKRTTVPDDVFIQFLAGRSKGFVIDPPNLPASYVDYLQVLLSLMNEESDQSDVLQGNVPSGVESGRAISLLQNAARGAIGFKSLYTERALAYFARLVLGMIRDFLPESEWSRIISEMPVHVLRSLRDRAKSLNYDIRVEVVSGRGANRQANQAEAERQFQMGLRGPRSTMRKLEIPNIEEEIQDILSNPLSPVAQQMMAAATPRGGDGDQGEES